MLVYNIFHVFFIHVKHVSNPLMELWHYESVLSIQKFWLYCKIIKITKKCALLVSLSGFCKDCSSKNLFYYTHVFSTNAYSCWLHKKIDPCTFKMYFSTFISWVTSTYFSLTNDVSSWQQFKICLYRQDT